MLDNSSLKQRFAIAMALTFAFYVLATTLALALIAVPILLYATTHRGNLWLAFFCVATGFAILRAIVPQRLKFEDPGVRFDEQSQPRLARLVADVSQQSGERAPDDMFLTLEMNAAVLEVGAGLRGGGRRVLIVGLPLLRTLTGSQLRAVIAHELGHYAGGDTRVGPVTYRTREAIGRTIASLSRDDSAGRRVVRAPFIWYGNAFLRITNAISRQQEFAADALAVRVAGRKAQEGTLRAVHAGGAAFDPYWAGEIVPALNAGLLPPVIEGFERFRRAPSIAKGEAEYLERELAEGKSSPYDSHPSLSERLEAIARAPEAARAEDDDSPALGLVDNIEKVEGELVNSLLTPEAAGTMRPVGWEAIGDELYGRHYSELVLEHGFPVVGRGRLSDLPAIAAGLTARASALHDQNDQLTSEAAQSLAGTVVGAALALALQRQGFSLHADPGDPVTLRRGEHTIEPFATLTALESGEMSADDWTQLQAKAGVSDAPLLVAENTHPPPAAVTSPD